MRFLQEALQLNKQVEEDYVEIRKMLIDMQNRVELKHNQFRKASEVVKEKSNILNEYSLSAYNQFEETKTAFHAMGEENVENVVDLKSLRGEHSEKIDRVRNSHFEENAEYLERVSIQNNLYQFFIYFIYFL